MTRSFEILFLKVSKKFGIKTINDIDHINLVTVMLTYKLTCSCRNCHLFNQAFEDKLQLLT